MTLAGLKLITLKYKTVPHELWIKETEGN